MTDTASPLDERFRTPSGIRTLTLGDTRLTYVPDGQANLTARVLLAAATEAYWAEHAAYLDDDGHLVAGLGALLVERDGRAMLIDAGMGPTEVTLPHVGVITGGTMLDNLAALGRSPEDIEVVALTHLHPDHSGWAWHPAPGGDRPPFTEASVVLTESEWRGRHDHEIPGLAERVTLGDLVKPMEPQVRTVADGEEIFPGVRVRFSPGHSHGHAAYVIHAGGKRVIAFGDAFHTPLQITHPLWENVIDHDHRQATALRRDLVGELAEPDTIGFGIHFPHPFGTVRDEAGRSVWHPIEA
ncbi:MULTISPECIES: MBL fold metallo-hydrolase [unclassified Streptomyces]|uniref:MBL fold metallo-hydrolase n=1 Tax=unclassified Streptomyces TaxID=2593676 RepID=UPI001DADCCFC|nr:MULTISPECIES: MBL fold metallo-hydrolase [unclassified Streptomyces]MBD0712339.1 hypothetical protein [Streptomyces sp. CBMA291]MBD0716713.1 hypothetical protein [Streptomyces sp. CBMA370]